MKYSKNELEEYQKRIEGFDKEGTLDMLENFNDFVANTNPEKELERILKHEKDVKGIDWLKFYDKDLAEKPKVASYLNKIGASFTADDLLGKTKLYNLPNYGISNSSDGNFIDDVQNYRGDQIKKYTTKMISQLQIAQNTFDVGDVISGTNTIFQVGIVSVGIKWAYDFGRGMIIGFGPRRAAIVAAQELGGAFCGNMIGLLVTYGIKALLDKDAQMLAVVVNRTGNEMNFTNSYAANGKVISLPKVSTGDIDSDNKNAISAGEKFDDIELVQAGWINASKRDSALVGVKAAFKIELVGDTLFKNGAYLGFSVPYSGSNSCGCSLKQFKSSKEYLSQSSKNYSLGQEENNGSAHIQANINSKGGGQVAMIAVIQEPFNNN